VIQADLDKPQVANGAPLAASPFVHVLSALPHLPALIDKACAFCLSSHWLAAAHGK
jgi:hypothetical protein